MKTRDEFIKKLQQLLLWKYNLSEIESTIKDYEQYFSTGKSMGKTEERMCMELGDPLAIVRELNVKRKAKGIFQNINHKAAIRTIVLMIWLILFGVMVCLWSDGSPLRIKLLISNPIVIVLGWYIAGGKEFTRVWTSQVEDTYKALKITIMHSLFLVMAILSVSLVTRNIMNWEVTIIVEDRPPVDLKNITLQVLSVFSMVAAIMMGFSIYHYRAYSAQYYSIICHGTGFICMMLSYMNVINHLESIQWGIEVVFRCEWVYIQSLILTSAFLIYCNWCRQLTNEKYFPY